MILVRVKPADCLSLHKRSDHEVIWGAMGSFRLTVPNPRSCLIGFENKLKSFQSINIFLAIFSHLPLANGDMAAPP